MGFDRNDYKPLSAEFLLSRGKCCNKGCLNCPYDIKEKRDGFKETLIRNCSGCKYHIYNEAMFDNGEDWEWWFENLCKHPSVLTDGKESKYISNYIKTPTPDWCPFLNKK